MKLSVSLPEEDVALLDAYARATGLPSRSAAVQHAVRLLRHADLEGRRGRSGVPPGDRAAWEETAGDGLEDAR
jgi:metal-responsive CopG/Arc/MetJ family transcriptional regulator